MNHKRVSWAPAHSELLTSQMSLSPQKTSDIAKVLKIKKTKIMLEKNK